MDHLRQYSLNHMKIIDFNFYNNQVKVFQVLRFKTINCVMKWIHGNFKDFVNIVQQLFFLFLLIFCKDPIRKKNQTICERLLIICRCSAYTTGQDIYLFQDISHLMVNKQFQIHNEFNVNYVVYSKNGKHEQIFYYTLI